MTDYGPKTAIGFHRFWPEFSRFIAVSGLIRRRFRRSEWSTWVKSNAKRNVSEMIVLLREKLVTVILCIRQLKMMSLTKNYIPQFGLNIIVISCFNHLLNWMYFFCTCRALVAAHCCFCTICSLVNFFFIKSFIMFLCYFSFFYYWLNKKNSLNHWNYCFCSSK
jgi:hypothetical protein